MGLLVLSALQLIGGKVPDQLLPPVPALIERPQVAQPPVMSMEQIIENA